jgi:hypothetical protein
MALGDDRTADEIRQSGDETSVLNAYTQEFFNTSQPGLTPAQRGETAAEDESWKLTANEDDPRWYEDDSDQWDEEPSEPAPNESVTYGGITFANQQVAEEWAANHLAQQQQVDPEAAAREQVGQYVDERIGRALDGLQQARTWAEQGRMEQEQRNGIRDAQYELNATAEGEAQLAEIGQAAATYHGLPQPDPEALQAEANALFEQAALNFVNNGGQAEDWQSAQQAVAAACVEQATVNLGRQQMSDNALKTFASPSQWRMVGR